MSSPWNRGHWASFFLTLTLLAAPVRPPFAQEGPGPSFTEETSPLIAEHHRRKCLARTLENLRRKVPASLRLRTKYRAFAMTDYYWTHDIFNVEMPDGKPIRYLKRRERQALEVVYSRSQRKWVYRRSGEPVSGGRYLAVMDPHGKIYLGTEFKEVDRHSSFLAGGPVASAGIAYVDGRAHLFGFKSLTGHYWREFKTPEGTYDSELNWRQFVNELRDRGVDMRKFLIGYKPTKESKDVKYLKLTE